MRSARNWGLSEAVLDGEIVAFDDQGRPSFERLQQRMHASSPNVIRRLASEDPVSYMIFDLLYLDGHTTIALPYRERRALLEGLELKGPAWQTPAYHAGEGRELLAAAAEQRLEGVVAKRLDSPYRPGKRTGEWLKIKNVNRQELVIGGWLPGKGARAGRLGALLMGYYEPDEEGQPALRYAGRVGTGFKEQDLEHLGQELAARTRSASPFAGTQPPRGARFVEPELVAEIEFRQWTHDRILRHSSYKGLREDKPAAEVRMERTVTPMDGRAAQRTSKTPVKAATEKDKKGNNKDDHSPRRGAVQDPARNQASDGDRGRGSHPEADEPREGHVPAHGVHEGRADRLLRRNCARAPAPSRRTAADAQALPRRGRGRVLLREALPRAPTLLGEDRPDRERAWERHDRLLPGRRSANVDLGRKSGRNRAAPEPLASRSG